MIVVLLVTFLILSCLPLLQAATNDKISAPVCLESFSCPNLAPFKYPFYNNATDEGCRLIKINCTQTGGEIQLEEGGQSYEIVVKMDSRPSVVIRNRTFEKLVKTTSCEALMNNFTSPHPLLYSVSVTPFITLFKCAKNLSYAEEFDAYFGDKNYHSCKICEYHNFYHKYLISNATVPSDLPHTCQVIQLPVKQRWEFFNEVPNETNIFSLLSPVFSIRIGFCRCHGKDRQCQAHDGNSSCLDTKKDKPPIKLILVITGSGFILTLSSAIFIIWRRCRKNPFNYLSSKDQSPSLKDKSLFCGVSVFSNIELEDATQNFDPSHELGDGGFGAVYYGKLKDGREVAVKKLYEHNYKRVQQFLNEVEILTRLRHPNLVVLYGFTSKQSHELLLVYEYIPNGTVSDHLHGEQANPTLLLWPIRMKIAIETASALVYLHSNEIIHRDVKTNNILLDHNFCVKVADFGLSRLIPNNVTHVSTAPQGTPGYLDPQYHQRYQLTDKSDVYSFGVVLVELITSMVAVDLKRSQDEISLANFALNRIQRCAFEQLIDPLLVSGSNSKMMTMIQLVAELAFRCLQYDSETRPTMNEVLYVLMDIQAEGKTDSHDNAITDSETIKSPPPSERNDTVVLLEDLLPSPVSISSEWESEKSASTTGSSNKDRLPMKN
ncbi:leaf rust 10 disease-resistance locus receptor-like protein kinase-like 1.1 protein, partial [Tanacetum coccineum]